MGNIEWNDNFSVGIPQLDDEHRQLIQMANTLYDAIKLGQGKTAAATILNELKAYALTHFSHEEQLMEQAQYPGYAAHKQLHAAFSKKVEEYLDLFVKNLLPANQLLVILRDWLIHHICNVDREYMPFLKKPVE